MNLASRLLVLIVFGALAGVSAFSAETTRTVSIVRDQTLGRAATHGLAKVRGALEAAGWTVNETSNPGDAETGLRLFAGTSAGHGEAAIQLQRIGLPLPEMAEALQVVPFVEDHSSNVVVCGADDRGLMYGLLDVAERISWAGRGAVNPWQNIRPAAEIPFIRDRSLSVYTMNRAHWESRFYDERYWARYFDLLAQSRFDRFLIVFGYENGGFLAPPYPYFFDTPGFHAVKMTYLTREQQRRNLIALNRLIELAHDRGIRVSLGIWDHIYRAGVQTGGAEWLADYKDRPVPNTVQGLTTQNLNAYTLASLQELLRQVPAMDALQFRIHEESGLKRDEMEAFWRDVFAQVQAAKPGMLVEARAKGIPDAVIATALAKGVNLRIETKYWMEQMGLPFHPTHVNPPNQHDRRHGYADLLKRPQRFPMSWRLWNGGTTRVLLWADPEYVRRYSESTLISDSPNWDVQEPLATKMEAQPPSAQPFALMPDKHRHYDYEFERYWHFFQVWGRVGYNPNTSPELWQRDFQRRFGAAGPHVETALHRASQVLPMIVAAVYPYKLFPTTRGWPERQSLGVNLADYANNEGTDTEQFESFVDAARRILAGGATAKRTPDATSRWFNETANAILAAAREAEAAMPAAGNKELAATLTDVRILAQLARFHGRRALAAVHYNLFKRGLRLAELLAATYAEKDAVAVWRELVVIAGDHYSFDLAMGARSHNLSGHWRDELKALEVNLKELEDQCCPPDEAVMKEKVWTPGAVDDQRPPQVEHERLGAVAVGQPVRITARVVDSSGVTSVRVRYRHVTQFEDYATLTMERVNETNEYAATIPGDFIVSEWDLMYFIEAIDRHKNGAIWPNLATETPYVIVKVNR